MKPLPEKIRNQLLKLMHARSQADADMDDLNAFLLQVVFALLLIFMCAVFLFMEKVGGELNQVENLQKKVAQIDTLKEQIVQAEEMEILRAVERVAEEFRIRYGLKEFLHIDPVSGEKEYEFQGVIKNGKFDKTGYAGRSFAAGALAAAKDYCDLATLEGKWNELVMALAGDAARRNPKVMKEQIAANIDKLKKEVIEVETLAVASLQEYLALHPEQVQDKGIRRMLQELAARRNPDDAARQFGELKRQLEEYVYRNLKAMCGCEMLEDLK